jgi:hypothetical protein
MCNDIRCFTWDDFVVECVSGIAGITCTCSIDGRLAGNCDDDLLTCSLEEGCCTQYLQP